MKTKKEKWTTSKKHPAWAKLDNTALLFPVIASSEMSSTYRISALLKEEIDGDILQEAQDILLPQFLPFRMRLKMGLFWYYFEENDRKFPKVNEETTYPGTYINKSRNNQYMFRVTYYKKRINLEVFHALTDGYGGLLFLKELVYQYLRLAHRDELSDEKDRLSPGVTLDMEDSYLKSFKSAKSHDEAYRGGKAVIIKGEKLPKGEMNLIHGCFRLDEIKAVAKKHHVTINQFLVGVFVYSIYIEYLKGAPSDRPINCCVPVDLRSFYDSNTVKNFFAMIMASFKPEDKEYSFEDVLAIVAESLNGQMNKENLDTILSYNVSNEQNVFLRPIPVFIKNIAIRSVYYATADKTTATMTNIGDVKFREPYDKYVDRVYAMLALSRGQDIKGTIVCCNGIFTVNFTSKLADVSIQKRFFRIMAQEGIDIMIETNTYLEDEI